MRKRDSESGKKVLIYTWTKTRRKRERSRKNLDGGRDSQDESDGKKTNIRIKINK